MGEHDEELPKGAVPGEATKENEFVAMAGQLEDRLKKVGGAFADLLARKEAVEAVMKRRERGDVASLVFSVLMENSPPSTFTEGGWRSEVEVLARRAYEAAEIFLKAGAAHEPPAAP